jgi:hypothetical protein
MHSQKELAPSIPFPIQYKNAKVKTTINQVSKSPPQYVPYPKIY